MHERKLQQTWLSVTRERTAGCGAGWTACRAGGLLEVIVRMDESRDGAAEETRAATTVDWPDEPDTTVAGIEMTVGGTDESTLLLRETVIS